MAATKQILLNAFNMNCVGHINHGLWTHPRDHSSDYNTLAYWTDQTKLLERGLFDGIFIADIIGVYDVCGGGIDVTAREAVQLPVNDQILLVSAMAAVTQNLGFGVTVNVHNEQPYTLARRFSTLDHLTRGRAGWNIVTGYLDSAHRGKGDGHLPEHDRRYDYADEYLEVLYKLWEGSWDDDAVRRDRAARILTDPGKSVPSRITVSSSTSKAITSRSLRSSAHLCSIRRKFLHAAGPSQDGMPSAGRRPDDIKIFVGIAVVPGRTKAEAEEKRDEYLRFASPEAGLAHFSASTGIDFARYGLDESIPYAPGNAIQSATAAAAQRSLTKRDLLKELAFGGRYAAITGARRSPVKVTLSSVQSLRMSRMNSAVRA